MFCYSNAVTLFSSQMSNSAKMQNFVLSYLCVSSEKKIQFDYSDYIKSILKHILTMS